MDKIDYWGGKGLEWVDKAHFGMSLAAKGAIATHEFRVDLTSIDPEVNEGPAVEGSMDQTSTYGVAIPRLYGRLKLGGNIFWLKGNKIDVRKRTEITENDSGGS